MPSKGQRVGVEARFWKYANKSGADKCWEWTAHRLPKGYGVMRIEHKIVKAHRVSYELHHGPIPDGHHVLHRCDNPPCVNPAHLWAGTNADNVADKEAKGRGNQPKGARHGRSSITEETARGIRAAFRAGEASRKRLAKLFGTTGAVVYDVLNRRTWRHVE